jgi:hypothetical protein
MGETLPAAPRVARFFPIMWAGGVSHGACGRSYCGPTPLEPAATMPPTPADGARRRGPAARTALEWRDRAFMTLTERDWAASHGTGRHGPVGHAVAGHGLVGPERRASAADPHANSH